MDPLENHQNSVNFDYWFNYFNQDDPTLFGDDTVFGLLDANQVSPFEQEKKDDNVTEVPYFYRIEDGLSLWDWLDGCLPSLDIIDKTNESHVTSGEADYATTITTTTTTTRVASDHGDRNGWRKTRVLELEEIEKHFEMPIAVAAKELNVGLTMLKKRCRELNIKRWPHRKLKSLKALIHNVKELGLEEEIERLEGQKMMMKMQPEMELTLRTKKLRQACFKATYKKKKTQFP